MHRGCFRPCLGMRNSGYGVLVIGCGEERREERGERREERGERREERGLDLSDLESIFIIALAALTHDPRPHALHATSPKKGLFNGRVNMGLQQLHQTRI